MASPTRRPDLAARQYGLAAASAQAKTPMRRKWVHAPGAQKFSAASTSVRVGVCPAGDREEPRIIHGLAVPNEGDPSGGDPARWQDDLPGVVAHGSQPS
jgi:hypothetical protein